MVVFDIMMKSVVWDLSSPNELKTDLSKKELVQLLRTNFKVLAQYTPSTKEIEDKVDEHIKECYFSSKHFFYEVEPVCSCISDERNEICKIQADMAKSLSFMKHLTTIGKKLFLENHLFNISTIDVDSLRFWLEDFQPCYDKLIMFIGKTGLIKHISFKKYDELIKQHLIKCGGPCKLNTIGFPTCKKNSEEKDKME